MSLQWGLPLTSGKRLTDPIHLAWGHPTENVPVKQNIVSPFSECWRRRREAADGLVLRFGREVEGEPDDDEDDESD